MNIYSLSQFDEEIKAVAMAKCSRSPNTFLQDAEAVTAEKAAEFHERIVVGYGHESVADMSIGSLVFENISTLLAEYILDIQTGKFQGKSSRYVPFSRDLVYNPYTPETESYAIYTEAINELFEAYENLHDPVTEWVKTQPNMVGKSAAVIRARVFDALRYLLPLGVQTNIASRLSSRDTAQLIRKLRTCGFQEGLEAALRVEEAAKLETPTLIRHANPSESYYKLEELGQSLPKRLSTWRNSSVKLISSEGSFSKFLHHWRLELGVDEAVPSEKLLEIYNDYMKSRVRRQDPVPHALRSVRFTFSNYADFGTWKDLRRHRRCELFREPNFTFAHGYTTSEDIKAMGGWVEQTYSFAMAKARMAWRHLLELEGPVKAQYLVTHGAIQHWLVDMDLEQLIYVTELRTAPGGHISYRRISRDYYDLAKAHIPELLEHSLVHDINGVEAHH